MEQQHKKYNRYEQQLITFLRILESYPEEMPLAKFLPGFFRENKQMGSNDRRTASRLLYNYFRLGKAVSELPAEKRLFIGEFLCSPESNPFLLHFRPDLDEKVALSLSDKVRDLESENKEFKLTDVFPFHKHLSPSIDKEAFLKSIFVQPDLFIRIQPSKKKLVVAKLEEANIHFEEEGDFTLRLPNGTKLNGLFQEENLYEVQDLSSQKTGRYFQPSLYDKWWDACAASGGKSLMLFSLQPQIKLVVSDIRESILNNLDARFTAAGLAKYQKKVLDLTKNPDPFLHDYEFDGIILDAPCTGSGTWGRTPEMISQFRESRIESFQKLQRSIAQNVVKYLKAGKPLIYITCSAFKEENEDVVDYLVSELNFKVEKQEVLKGYEHKADTMFVARLIKS